MLGGLCCLVYVYVCVPFYKLTEVWKIKNKTKQKSVNFGNFVDVGDKREGQARDKKTSVLNVNDSDNAIDIRERSEKETFEWMSFCFLKCCV